MLSIGVLRLLEVLVLEDPGLRAGTFVNIIIFNIIFSVFIIFNIIFN
jgi:hypothetical protein